MPNEKWGQSLNVHKGKGTQIIRKMRTECKFKKMVMTVQPHPARVPVLCGC